MHYLAIKEMNFPLSCARERGLRSVRSTRSIPSKLIPPSSVSSRQLYDVGDSEPHADLACFGGDRAAIEVANAVAREVLELAVRSCLWREAADRQPV